MRKQGVTAIGLEQVNGRQASTCQPVLWTSCDIWLSSYTLLCNKTTWLAPEFVPSLDSRVRPKTEPQFLSTPLPPPN
jgi:hypothetical protein